MHTVEIVVIVVAVIVWVIGRQLRGEPIRGKRLIVLPMVLTIIGAVDLANDHSHPAHALDIVLVGASVVIAIVIGAAQGAMMRLENRGGALWGQLPVAGVGLWVAFILTRVGIEVGAHAAGAQLAASTAPLLLVLGINRLTQAGVIALRATTMGIPFAAEKDGSTFLSGTVGQRPSGPRENAGHPNPSGNQTWPRAGQQLGNVLNDRRAQRRQRRGH